MKASWITASKRRAKVVFPDEMLPDMPMTKFLERRTLGLVFCSVIELGVNSSVSKKRSII